MSDMHWSDCAVHNEPAMPNGPCDCGGYSVLQDRERLAMLIAEALARCDGLKFGLPYKPWERHGYAAADAVMSAIAGEECDLAAAHLDALPAERQQQLRGEWI